MLFDFIKRFWFINPSTGFFISGGGGAAASYQITNSVRLRAASSAYFSRTPAGAEAVLTKCCISMWVKRGLVTETGSTLFSPLLGAGTSGPAYTMLALSDSAGGMTLQLNHDGYQRYKTNAVFRDPTAWMHLFCKLDSTASAGSRFRVWQNGVELTTTVPNEITSSDTFELGNAILHTIGKMPFSGYYFDGYIADAYLVCGTSTPAATDFGQSDINGVWVPKAYTGTYGTNGCKLDFKDPALTVASNVGLGKDTSGNTNYWVTNSISVTAGVTYDSMVDTPTNNYATLNPIVGTFAGTLADAALKFTSNATTAYSTIAVSTGKWWWEVVVSTVGADPYIGMMDSTYIKGDNLWASEFYAYKANGQKYNGSAAAYGATYTSSDVLGFALDVDTGTIEVYKQTGGAGAFASQGVMFNSGVSGKTWRPAIYGGASSTVAHFNAGQRPFNYVTQHGALPTGFKALCTANLPAVAIAKPAAHFNAKTRVGTAATYSVTGEAFQPDFVWVKSRGRALDHALYDSVRGVQKRLETNNTDAEVTGDSTGLTAFNSDGYTGGALDQINGTTATNAFVDWLWKAGGAPTTDNVAGAGNTPTAGSVKIDGANLGSALAGTIAATRLSANTTAGFSVVTYTGTGANATIAHGLGVAPKMVITRCRNHGSARNWSVWHSGIANTEFLNLNGTDAKATDATMWNSTSPTTSVFSVGSNSNSNLNTYTFVAYCFAEVPGYSKFGSYVGNAAADGPFVYCGFRPKYLLIKTSVSAANAWYIHDAARDTYNQMNHKLYPDVSTAENTAADNMIDFTANGFKVRSANTSTNDTNTMIFAAFAEFPFGGSNVAPSPAR